MYFIQLLYNCFINVIVVCVIDINVIDNVKTDHTSYILVM